MPYMHNVKDDILHMIVGCKIYFFRKLWYLWIYAKHSISYISKGGMAPKKYLYCLWGFHLRSSFEGTQVSTAKLFL